MRSTLKDRLNRLVSQHTVRPWYSVTIDDEKLVAGISRAAQLAEQEEKLGCRVPPETRQYILDDRTPIYPSGGSRLYFFQLNQD